MERCWTKVLLQPVKKICRQYMTIHKNWTHCSFGILCVSSWYLCSNDGVKGCNQEASSQLGPRPVGDPSASAAMDGVICAAATMKDKQNPARPPVWSRFSAWAVPRYDKICYSYFDSLHSYPWHICIPAFFVATLNTRRLNPSLGIFCGHRETIQPTIDAVEKLP